MTTYPQYPGQYPPPAPEPAPKAKKGRVHWLWLIGAFFLGSIIGGSTGGSEPATQAVASAPTRSVSPAPATVAPTRAAVEPVEVGPRAEWPDGLWIVGEDLDQGEYQTAGAKKGFFEFCSISLKDGPTSTADTIGGFPLTANADERIVFEVTSDVKAIEVNGCEPVTKRG